MGSISFTPIQDGTSADASDVNPALSTIYDEFNGNIEADNLANSAVTTAKIADGAITDAKLSTAAGELGAAWTAYTPTIAAGSINSSDSAYIQIGKTVIYRVVLDVASVTSTSFTVSLPVTAATLEVGEWKFPCNLNDVGSANYSGLARIVSTTTLQFAGNNVGTGNYIRILAVSSTAPFTWASGDEISATIVYEAA